MNIYIIHLCLLKAHQNRVPNEHISMQLNGFPMILNEQYYVYDNSTNVYIITQWKSLSFILNGNFLYLCLKLVKECFLIIKLKKGRSVRGCNPKIE